MRDRKFVAAMKRGKLVVLVGPTGVGKTAVALWLAAHFRTEVVSADSRQVFREMTIGTAKPTADELARITHHFIGSRTVSQGYDAATYGEEATSALAQLFEQHDWVVLCGGSGLYIKAVLDGFDDIPAVPPEVRAGIVADYNQHGLVGLQRELEEKDPGYYEVVDRQNPQRLMRALEVIRYTGETFSGFHRKSRRGLPYEVIKIGLELERTELYRRIEARMDHMIDAGLFEEAEALFPHRHHPALQTVGYQEIFGFLEGKYDRDEAIRLLKRNSRHYAKRQLTWFRRDPGIRWFHPDDRAGILSACQSPVSA